MRVPLHLLVPILIRTLVHAHDSESAATLEAESGYSMESPEVTLFRQHILDGMWTKAEARLPHLCIDDPEALLVR